MGKELERGAGILLPISSLPSPYGIGTLGDKAYEFVDMLRSSGQKYWQVLPVGPTSFGDSPYQSFSTFAGNPYFIDLDYLVEEGLLDKEELDNTFWGSDSEFIEYDVIYNARFNILRKAYKASLHKKTDEYKKFLEENKYWLHDYALFMAIKADHNNEEWLRWEKDIRFRKPETVARYEKKLADDIDFYKFLQYKFYEQWLKLKAYANRKGIQIIGDIPIYVALDSADVWTNHTLFQLDNEWKPINVAGCPPDMFSSYGQKWGNPIYDWKAMEKTDFAWWKKRMAASARLYDVTRIDHFIGIVRYYNIPLDKDPIDGFYAEGPGIKLIKAIDSAMGDAKVIAEDLGVVVPEVTELIKKSGYPGMKVLQFAFDSREESDYLPHNYNKNCVVYTGTHDNSTVRGWYKEIDDLDKKMCMDYINSDDSDEENISWDLICIAMRSVADTCVIPVQDFLGLDESARINTPSTLGDNWKWRMTLGCFSQELIDKIKRLTKIYGRI